MSLLLTEGVGVPDGYGSWNEAIRSFVKERGDNKTPEEVEPRVWKAFETMAIKFVPKVSV